MKKSVENVIINESSDESMEKRCDSLIFCIITALNHGLRNGGGIGDVLRIPSKRVIDFVDFLNPTS